VLAVVVVGVLIPQSPLSSTLGFAPLPPAFFAVLVAFVLAYLASVEIAKYYFFKVQVTTTDTVLRRDRPHRIHRLAARWSHHEPLSS
jgi:Mg2+-importing ATPase